MDLVAYTPRLPDTGETLTGHAFETIPGGKGANQAIAASRAGASVRMVGAVGSDAFGADLRATLAAAGVDPAAVRTVEGASGTAHITVDDQGQNTIVVVPGANGTVTELTDAERAVVAASSTVLLQLELPLSAVVQAAQVGHGAGAEVVLTPAPAVPLPDDLYAAVDVLVPNAGEATRLTGESGVETAAKALLRKVPAVVVTLGGDGCLLFTADGEELQLPALPVDVVDTTAAGDTFAGALAVARAEGRAWPDALRWASAAAAISVGRKGASTSAPVRAEIDERYGMASG
ncbi:MAG: ribokinase [Streptosporangiales bacterium]|nr:ribokinase [Streptosporangiales bacterium]